MSAVDRPAGVEPPPVVPITADDLQVGDVLENVGRVEAVGRVSTSSMFWAVQVSSGQWSLATGTLVLTNQVLILHGADVMVVRVPQ